MPNQFKAHLYFIQSICGFLELPDAPCHLKKTWHLLMILITRGGCFFVLKAATALQCFGIQLRDLLIPTGGIVSCWSKGYIAEGLGFLPATCSVRTIYQGASEIVKAMLCYTRVSVAGWHQPSEVLMTYESYGLYLLRPLTCTHHRLSNLPSFNQCCLQDLIVAHTCLMRPCAITIKDVSRWKWMISPFVCKVGAFLSNLPSVWYREGPWPCYISLAILESSLFSFWRSLVWCLTPQLFYGRKKLEALQYLHPF